MLYRQVSFLLINLLLLHVNCSSRMYSWQVAIFFLFLFLFCNSVCLKKSGQWSISMNTAGITQQELLHSEIQIHFFLSALYTKVTPFRASN